MRDDFEGTNFDLTKVGLTGAGRHGGPWGSPDRGPTTRPCSSGP